MAQYFTDFEDQTLGAFPSGWTGRITELTGWEIVSPDPAHGKAVASTTAGSGRKALTWDVVGSSADVEIYFECGSVSGTPLNDLRSALRLDPFKNTTSSTAHLYVAGISAGDYSTSKYVDGSFSSIFISPTDPSPGLTSSSTVYAVRVSVVGTAIKLKSWDTAGSEPVAWGAETTDTSISESGAVGLFVFAQSTSAWWSAFGVGTDGDPAPTSAVVVPGLTLTSITPTTGPSTGGTTVTMTGTGFEAGTVPKFNGVDATSVVIVSPTELTCATPAL